MLKRLHPSKEELEVTHRSHTLQVFKATLESVKRKLLPAYAERPKPN